jgi:transposase
MRRFVEGTDRGQSTLFPECLGDWISEDNPVRVIDVFVDELDLAELGFDGVEPEVTGRPSYHPSVLLKLYIYGYLNRVQSSRRLEREAGRNVEVMWLTGRLAPDHKTIADFRKDNGTAIRKVCARFVALCRMMGLLTQASVAIDGSKFKAVNNRDHVTVPMPVEGMPEGWSARVLVLHRPDGAIEVFLPLLKYFKAHETRSSSWQDTAAQAVGLLWDYGIFTKDRNPGRNARDLFRDFATALAKGTIGTDAADSIGLFWPATPYSRCKSLIKAIEAFAG